MLVVLTLPVVAFVIYGILKGWYTQAVLIVAGFALVIGGVGHPDGIGQRVLHALRRAHAENRG